MTVTIPVFWVVVLIVVIHSILQHLLNWGMRLTMNEDVDSSLSSLISFLFIIEFMVVLGLLATCLL